jgi:hypothetical protein
VADTVVDTDVADPDPGDTDAVADTDAPVDTDAVSSETGAAPTETGDTGAPIEPDTDVGVVLDSGLPVDTGADTDAAGGGLDTDTADTATQVVAPPGLEVEVSITTEDECRGREERTRIHVPLGTLIRMCFKVTNTGGVPLDRLRIGAENGVVVDDAVLEPGDFRRLISDPLPAMTDTVLTAFGSAHADERGGTSMTFPFVAMATPAASCCLRSRCAIVAANTRATSSLVSPAVPKPMEPELSTTSVQRRFVSCSKRLT